MHMAKLFSLDPLNVIIIIIISHKLYRYIMKTLIKKIMSAFICMIPIVIPCVLFHLNVIRTYYQRVNIKMHIYGHFLKKIPWSLL